MRTKLLIIIGSLLNSSFPIVDDQTQIANPWINKKIKKS